MAGKGWKRRQREMKVLVYFLLLSAYSSPSPGSCRLTQVTQHPLRNADHHVYLAGLTLRVALCTRRVTFIANAVTRSLRGCYPVKHVVISSVSIINDQRIRHYDLILPMRII